ncbi:potassium:proton antiporter [Aureococcus anophagefferens]|uniref:Potassium:proton antiporter n=1 Tax=Aureococcus anophagefferens TaxID=44056 RepID=A0ABR1G1V6_AURAN
MMAVRALMVLALYPILANMGYGTDPKAAGFMVWGGLRAPPAWRRGLRKTTLQQNGDPDDAKDGKRILFHVAGLAFLTLTINGTTAGPLLKLWGMVGLPELKKQLVAKFDHDAAEMLDHISSLKHLKDTEHATPTALGGGGRGDFEAPKEDHDAHHVYSCEELEALLASFGAAPNPEELVLLRETFYRIVKSEYWEMIEDGQLPAQIGGSGQDAFFETLDDIPPDSRTIDNQLHYLLNYKKHEIVYYLGNLDEKNLSADNLALLSEMEMSKADSRASIKKQASIRRVNSKSSFQPLASSDSHQDLAGFDDGPLMIEVDDGAAAPPRMPPMVKSPDDDIHHSDFDDHGHDFETAVAG